MERCDTLTYRATRFRCIVSLYITSQLSLEAGHYEWGRLTDRNMCN